jgi:hypothetical protein
VTSGHLPNSDAVRWSPHEYRRGGGITALRATPLALVTAAIEDGRVYELGHIASGRSRFATRCRNHSSNLLTGQSRWRGLDFAVSANGLEILWGVATPPDQYEAITAALRPLVEEVTGDYKITLSDGAIPGGGRQWAVKVFPFDPQIAERIRACVAEFGINVEEDSMGPHRGFLLSTAAVRVLPAFEIDGLVNARLWLDGFWQRINGALGTLIDAYEEEDLAPEDAARNALLGRSRIAIRQRRSRGHHGYMNA